MKKEILLSLIAVCSGVLLTLMIMSNSYLSTFTSPLQASWLTHGIGSMVALLIWLMVKGRLGKTQRNHKIPRWSYLGGSLVPLQCYSPRSRSTALFHFQVPLY